MDSFLECGRDAGNAGLFQGGENNGVQVCLQIWAPVDTTHSYTVLIYAYIDEAARALGERGFEEITAENVYYGRSERMAGYKFYTAVRAAMANPLAFSVALWRDNEVIARAKL